MKKVSLNHIRTEYKSGILDEMIIHPDPFIQFADWFEEVLNSGIGEPTAMFLATAGKDGIPSGRIVLLKGFDKRGFVFFTHHNSRKGRNISENPWVSITFHWKELERQLRIVGRAKKVSSKESDEYFLSRPFESQVSACISPQSEVVTSRKFLEQKRDDFLRDIRDKQLTRPPDWGGFRVQPILFEFWQGREQRLHDRIQYRKVKSKWIIERLAP
jgi:pyridoxamine 5'-phosphate oxidase